MAFKMRMLLSEEVKTRRGSRPKLKREITMSMIRDEVKVREVRRRLILAAH